MSHQSDLIAEDILGYLKQHENKDLLRFITCGNVDDGKSTLIGRLLHDSKLIFEDQLAAIQKDSQKYNTTDQEIDLALLVDGLQAEREQGITIDVAYRYFSTDKRKFIIADCPGHEQYTRNMATGASTSNLAIILIDARYGVQTQTRRHSYIVSLLGIQHVIVAINKMDIVDYREEVFENIRRDYLNFAKSLHIPDIEFVPLSALRGDNVVNHSSNTPWYKGKTLIEFLETVETSNDVALPSFRLPVQYVNRPNLDFRGFCGTVAAGAIKQGDEIVVLPSGQKSRVKQVLTAEGEAPLAFVGQAITLTLETEIDISRGDSIVRADESAPSVSQSFDAHIVWMNETPLTIGKEYRIKLAGKTVPGRVERILHRVDINALEQKEADQLALNEIGLCRIVVNVPVSFDNYRDCRGTGSFILIDRLTNATAGAGMVAASVQADLEQLKKHQFEWLSTIPAKELHAFVSEHYPEWGVTPWEKLGQ